MKFSKNKCSLIKSIKLKKDCKFQCILISKKSFYISELKDRKSTF